jgi:hypothetical protein
MRRMRNRQERRKRSREMAEMDYEFARFMGTLDRLANLAERYVVAFERSVAVAELALDRQTETLESIRKDLES